MYRRARRRPGRSKQDVCDWKATPLGDVDKGSKGSRTKVTVFPFSNNSRKVCPKKVTLGVRGKSAAPVRCSWPLTGPKLIALGHTFLCIAYFSRINSTRRFFHQLSLSAKSTTVLALPTPTGVSLDLSTPSSAR